MESTKLPWATGVLLFALLGTASAQCVCNSTLGIREQAICSVAETCDATDASCCQPCQWEPLQAQTLDGARLLNRDDTTPHGFATSDLPALEDSETPRPCGSITDDQFSQDTTTYVLVWAQTYLSGVRICVEQVGSGARVCGSGSVYFCEIAIDETVRVKFTCDTCDNSEQSFYYLIKTETLEADNDQFCSDSEADQAYPSDLTFVIFPPVDPEDEDSRSDSRARPLVVFSPLLILLAAIATRLFTV